MKRIYRFFLASLCFVATSSEASYNVDMMKQSRDYNDPFQPRLILKEPTPWFVGIGGGWDSLYFENLTRSLLNNIANNPNDTFTLNDDSQHTAFERIVFGYCWEFDSFLHHISIQAEVDHSNSVEVKGTRVALGDPANFSSNYTFDVARQLFLFSGKINFIHSWQTIMPYFEAGIGFTRNEFSNYKDLNAALSMPAFPDHTNYAFATTIGAGIDWHFAKLFSLSAGYRVGYWGNLESGSVSTVSGGQSLPAPIHLEHPLYSHQILITLRYFFAKDVRENV